MKIPFSVRVAAIKIPGRRLSVKHISENSFKIMRGDTMLGTVVVTKESGYAWKNRFAIRPTFFKTADGLLRRIESVGRIVAAQSQMKEGRPKTKAA